MKDVHKNEWWEMGNICFAVKNDQYVYTSTHIKSWLMCSPDSNATAVLEAKVKTSSV